MASIIGIPEYTGLNPQPPTSESLPERAPLLEVKELRPTQLALVSNLLLTSSAVYEYTKSTLNTKMPAILQAQLADKSQPCFGIWREANFAGFLRILRSKTEVRQAQIEFVIAYKYFSECLQDVILESALTLCAADGVQRVQIGVHKNNILAQHCFFRHGFRPVPDLDASGFHDSATQWVAMFCELEERQELSLRRYYKDLELLSRSLSKRYKHQFPPEFVADYNAFLGEFVI